MIDDDDGAMPLAAMPTAPAPLATERVLDLSTDVAGAYCAKLLGDLGARVVKVEGPEGDPTRYRGPFPNERADPERSSLFHYLHTSKRSIVLDVGDAADRDRLALLVATHDIVIADGTAADLDRRGIGLATLGSWNPSGIVTTISGFGSTGPYADYRSNHLITCALGGWSVVCGTPDREPLQSGASLSQTVSGAYAAVATLCAVEGRARHGRGDHIDVSSWEAAITCAMGPTSSYEFRGVIDSRHSDYTTGPSFNLECRDGYIGVNVLTEAQWQTLCAFVGKPDMIDDPRFADYFGRLTYIEEIRAVIAAAFANRDAEEIMHDAQLWRLPFGIPVSPAEALRLSVHAERDYLVEVDHPVAGPVRTPRVPFLMSATQSLPTRPPLLGEHTDEVLAEAARRNHDHPAAVTNSDTAADADADAVAIGPLAGLRILDLTMFMSGPLATLIAGDLGADVIKIEALQRLDGWRGVGRGGDRPWESSGPFNWINRNKRGITLNLADPRGSAILRRLVEQADVVIENYTPRVMGNFGLGYERLRMIKPDLIMLSMPGFGAVGDWRDYAAFAWTTEQMSTICHLTGYPESGPLFTGTTCGDPLAGLMGALAMLAAVNHRRRTGEGQHIDLSQVEASTTFVGEKLIECQLIGADPMRAGNANSWMAPHGIYPCDDDRWVAIACEDDDQWRALWSEMELGGPLPYQSVEDRLSSTKALDELIAAWTAGRDADELMHRLQSLGIAAATVMNGRDMLADAHLREREWFVMLDREEIGVKHHLGEPFRFRDAILPPPQRAAYLGEHNHQILGGELGLTAGELDELERDKVIGTMPIGTVTL